MIINALKNQGPVNFVIKLFNSLTITIISTFVGVRRINVKHVMIL
jgi:hypothetical protein